jgi:cytoskeletal protein CcmA (bactofilin family)
MADTGKADDFSTIIGKDATFKGELAFESGVRIDGTLEGKVQTKGRLQVSKEGTLQADVEAGSISVEGTVKGNMTAADRIEVRESANITGDLVSSRLVVAEGATLTGQVKIGAGAKPRTTTAPTRPMAPPPAHEGKGEGPKS